MARFINPFQQHLDNAGNPLVEGKLYFYKSGTNTLQATFKDINLSIANTNPVELTGSGREPNIWLQNASYKVVLTDKDDQVISERDPVGGEGAEGNLAIWNSLTIYSQNDLVKGSDGKFYMSLTNDNQGNDPVGDITNWSEVKFTFTWNPNQTYAQYDIVIGTDGNIYTSTTAGNLNNNPLIDDVNWQSSRIPPVVLAAARMYAYENF